MDKRNEHKENNTASKKFGFDDTDGELVTRMSTSKAACKTLSTATPQRASPARSTAHKRRAPGSTKIDDSDEDDDDTGLGTTDVTNLLQSFGAEVSKAIVAKRKRLKSLTATTYKNSCQKIDELLQTQQTERKMLFENYQKEVANVFKLWELEMEKIREHEEELQATLVKQQKALQQKSAVQRQRLGALRKLFEDYNKASSEMSEIHQTQCATVQLELKKEMEALQKKILMESQNQEMANVKKSLQTFFFTP